MRLYPEVELDNNWSDRALRKIALIRNNSMYAGGHDGAKRLCTLLTLTNVCPFIEMDPLAYRVWALTRVVPHRDNRGHTARDLASAATRPLRGVLEIAGPSQPAD